MANRVEEAVEKIAEEILANTDYELVDVEYVKERDWFLLEELNIINDRYILEVSSPGLDRALKKEKDFKREMGKLVDITLYKAIDGEKMITGKLTGYTKDIITIDETREIALKDIALVRLHIDF